MILGQAALVRKAVGTWLFPACLFGVFWFAFTFLPLLFVSAPINPLSIGFILVAAITFSSSALFFTWNRAFRLNRLNRESAKNAYNTSFIRSTFYLSTVLALAFIGVNSVQQGFSITDVRSDLVGSAAQYASLRAASAVSANIFSQLSLVLIYLAASIGGLLLSHAMAAKRRAVIITLALIPSAVVMTTQSAKGAMFVSLSLLYGGILLGWVRAGNLQIFSPKAIAPTIGFSAGLMALVGYSFLSRGLYGSSDLSSAQGIGENLLPYFVSYFFGHLYAFSDWLTFLTGDPSQFLYSTEQDTYGFYTFNAIFKALGSARTLPDGVFSEAFSQGDLIVTNIYTVYRSLITDFGVTGSILFTFVTGWLWHLSYRLLLIGRRPFFTASTFVLMIGYMIHSYLGSLFMYTSFYACWFLLTLVLYLNDSGRRAMPPAATPLRTATPGTDLMPLVSGYRPRSLLHRHEIQPLAIHSTRR